MDTSVQEFVPEDIYVRSWARRLAEILIDLTLSFIISYVGVVTNVLTIIVFTKQKFKDSVAVSMTAISIWDLVKCLGCALQRLSGPVGLCAPATAESWSNISVVAFSYLTCFSTYVSIVLAAYVAVERCLCVSIPFKVKWLITPRSSFIICLFISLLVFGWFSVMYCIYDISWVYSHHYNETIAIYYTNDFFNRYKKPLFLYYNLSGIIWPVVCFVVIVVSTVVIIYHLKRSSHFRSRNVKSSLSQSPQFESPVCETREDTNHLSTRDRQIVKMLLVIIAVYVVSLSPRIAHYMVKYFVYEFYFIRKYHNLFMVMAYILTIFDLINGATNLFVFLAMSSSFRATFRELNPSCDWLSRIFRRYCKVQ